MTFADTEKMSKTMARPESRSSRIAIAAIDFGTTCTGYAYYFRKDANSHINDINTDQAWIGSSEMGLQAPTTVLMDSNKRFHSFGFEAEAKYKSLTLKNEHRSWYYFQHFKMKLHHEQDLSRDMVLKDADGKPMKAMGVFTEAIKYVKKHLMEKLKQSLRDEISLRDIKWVITVPAIWRNSAKQFMRESASKAGIPNDQLTLALEPESAAIFCKELSITRAEGVDGVFLRAFDPGEKYIVVDLGGGTVDTTGHEVLADGSLKELHAASGGPWGGTLVNEAFEHFIQKMVTPDVFRRFCKECTSDLIEFKKDFEKQKRSFSKNTEEVDINFPVDLAEFYHAANKLELRTRLKDDEYRNKVELVKHCLVIKPKLMMNFFSVALNELIGLIDRLLKKKELKSTSSILLVGGFSESPIVSSKVREYFNTMRVIAPGNASVAILKGAVMFGNNPRAISSRISPFTYGVHTRKLFNPTNHPANRRKVIRGKEVVDNAFDIHIKAGENVYVGGSSNERTYVISNRKNPYVYWKVYQADDRNPQFCDDDGCMKLGRLEINLPEDLDTDRLTMKLSMTCRGTELEASACVPDRDIHCKAVFEFLADDYVSSDDDTEIEMDI